MPETPVVQNIVIEEAPVVSSFPLRQGEEKHAAGLELDQAMRQDSRIADLEAQIAALTGQAKPMMKMKEGPGAIKRRRILQDKVKELKSLTRKEGDHWEGPCAPFTIVNFNPVKLELQGELADQGVPAAGSSLKKVTFPYKGRSFVGSFVTLWNPKVYPVVIGTENLNGEDVQTIRADYFTPMAIAHNFFEHYVFGAANALGMGGLFIFEGDIHTLSQRRTDKSGGKLRTPVVDVANSTPSKPAYMTVERYLHELLGEALMQQRRYAEFVIAEGHGFYHSANPEEQKQLTITHHVLWHNWAVERGYKTEPEEWASDLLIDSPDVKAVNCPGCGTKQPKNEPHLCPNCNAPFDALKSYLAGMPVPEVWLTRYEGKEFEQILKEKKRREEKSALLAAPAEEKKAKS
jgi:hypothetical protein